MCEIASYAAYNSPLFLNHTELTPQNKAHGCVFACACTYPTPPRPFSVYVNATNTPTSPWVEFVLENQEARETWKVRMG
jgi:hypothetical protein